jgi:hypothetical protein
MPIQEAEDGEYDRMVTEDPDYYSLDEITDVDVYPGDESRVACVFRTGNLAIVDMNTKTFRYQRLGEK